MMTLKITRKIETIFVLTAQDVNNALEGFDKEVLGVNIPAVEVPFTKKQIDQVLAAIPHEYWKFACCSFRHQGHTTLTCPVPNIPQRIFFRTVSTYIRWPQSRSSSNVTKRNGRP